MSYLDQLNNLFGDEKKNSQVSSKSVQETTVPKTGSNLQALDALFDKKNQAATESSTDSKINFNHINELLSKSTWTDTEKGEAESALNELQGSKWQNLMYNLTGSDKFTPGYITSSAKEAAKTGDYSAFSNINKVYTDLYNRVHSKNAAVQFGLLQGTGATSLANAATAAANKIAPDSDFSKNLSKQTDYVNKATQQSAAENPGYATAGNVAGAVPTIMTLGGLSEAATGLLKVTPAIRSIINSGLAFGEYTAAQEAGAAATGNIDAGRYARDIGVSTLGGMAGAFTSGVVSSGIAKALSKYGLQKPFAEFTRRVLSGTSFAAGDIAVTYPLSEEKPTNQQMLTQLGTAFLFSMIEGGISTYNTTAANKSALNSAVSQMEAEYQQMAAGAYSSEEAISAADRMLQYSKNIRTAISQNYYAGQQEYINQVLKGLDAVDDYVMSVKATAGSMATPSNLLGTSEVVGDAAGNAAGLVPVTPSTPAKSVVGMAANAAGGAAANLVPSIAPKMNAEGLANPVGGISEPNPTTTLGGLSEPQGQKETAQAVSAPGMAKVQEAAATFGDRGSKAFLSSYDENVSLTEFYKDFAKMYNIGKTSGAKDVEGLSGSELEAALPEAKALSSAQKFAAFISGMNDSNASAENAGQVAAEAKSTEGLVSRNGYTLLSGKALSKVESSKLTSISSLSQKIAEAWNGSSKESYAGLSDLYGYDGQAVASWFDTKDITSDTNAWGDEELDQWAMDNVFKPNGITGVKTSDGAVLFNEDGGMTNGTEEGQIDYGSSERGAGVRAGRQGGRVEESAARYQGREEQRQLAESRRSQIRVLEVGEQSTQSLGISAGTSKKTLRVVPASAYDSELKAVSKQNREAGRQVVFFTGSLDTVSGEARGAIIGNRMFVQVDNEKVSATQISKHEEFHGKIQSDPDLKARSAAAAMKRFSEEEFMQLMEYYVEVYSNMSAADAMEEILCDAYADINIFEGIDIFGEGAAKFSGAVREAAGNEMTAAATEQTTGPPADSKLSLNPTFQNAYDAWANHYPDKNIALYVGSTSEALQSVGVSESRITWDTKKIRNIKEKHPGMTDEVLKQVPNLIENPILIMESRTVSGRLTLLGDLKDQNGLPVMAALELHPTKNGVEIDEIKIASAYARQESGGPAADQNLIDNSKILYVDSDAEKVNAWLSGNRLQLPFPATRDGNISVSTDSIRDSSEKNNTPKTKFSMEAFDGKDDIVKESGSVESENFMRWFGDWKSENGSHSVVVDKEGKPLVVYHGTGTVIEEFEPDFTGQGNDQYGSGFYFASEKEQADLYQNARQFGMEKPGGEDSPNTIPVYLNIRNPIIADGNNLSDSGIKLTKKQAASIIKKAPNLYDEDESPLGDWYDIWSDGIKNWMVDEVAGHYTGYSLMSLENDFFKGYATAFRNAVFSVTGHDGVIHEFPDGTRHYVAWFPNQIKHATDNSGAYSPEDNRIRFSRPASDEGMERAVAKARDSEGNELTTEQAEFFKDSKVRDENGNLYVVYHGTDVYNDFSVFRRGKRGWLGPGIYLTSKHQYAKDYAEKNGYDGRVYSVYANIENPLIVRTGNPVPEILKAAYGRESVYDARAKKQTNDVFILTTTDINKLKRLGYDGILWKFGGEVEASVFEPQQIKNTSNYKPTTSSDIRYSSEEADRLKDLSELNAHLREQVEYWKGQMKRTDKAEIRREDVAKAARSLAKGTSLKTSDVESRLQELYNFIANSDSKGIIADWDDIKEKAIDIARDVVQNASELVDNEGANDYREIRSDLRRMKLAYVDRGDIADFDSFRKRNFGRFTISRDGTPVDMAYQELTEKYGESYFPSEIQNASDQLEHISELLDSLRPVYENPYNYHMAEAIEYTADEIIDGFFATKEMPMTFADRQVAKLDLQKENARQKLADLRTKKNEQIKEIQQREAARRRDAIAAERKRRDEKVEALKEHYREVAQNRRDRKTDSAARSKLLSIAKRLQNKKLPAVNRALLDQYIGDLDTVSRSITGKTLGKLTDLREWYEDQRDKNPDFIADQGIEKVLQRLSKKQISDLSSSEVADLTNILLNFENELRMQRNLIGSKEKRDIYGMGVQVILDIENSSGSRESGAGGILDKYIVTETLSPVRQIRRMTGYVDDDPLYVLTTELADGQRNMFDYQRRAYDRFKKFTEDKDFVKSIAGKDAKTFEIVGIGNGGPATVKITAAMRMSLYLHSLNDQNLKHIAGGGITVPDWVLYKDGKIAEAYARGTTVKLTPSQVRSIAAGMTEKERSFAMAASNYFNSMSRDEINAISEKLKGYSLAQVENYFPINTDTSFTKSDFEAIKYDGSIEGMGFLKERVNASNPILLRDMNDVLLRSIDQHARYIGLAIPIRNFNKVWGVTKGSFNEDGSRNSFESSVQKMVKSKWGDAGYSYIEKMMADLNGSHRQVNKWAKALSRVRSNYAGAVLTLNASVAMKQAASYPTAGAVIGFKALAKALSNFGKVDLDLIAKYTPLQWYRSQGFSTQELGDLTKQDKRLPKLLNWVQGVDLITTRKLWKAAEYYIRDTDKSLKVGSEEYYQAVADIYNQIIEETQPNYTTMQRPQLLRSEDTLMQNLAMFKTQPFQNFNILYDAAGNLSAKKKAYGNTGTGEAKEAYKEAKKRFGWATVSQLMQLAVFAGMTFAWNMFRNKKDKYQDGEENMTVLSTLGGIGKDMIGGAAASVPFGADVWELTSSFIFGDTYYGFDAVTSSAINDMANALIKAGKSLTSIWQGATDPETDIDWNEQRLRIDSVADAISKVIGVPYENVTNLFNAVFQQAAVSVSGKYLGGYAALKLATDPKSYSSDYYDLLYSAYSNDQSAYEKIYADMVESGSFTEEKIKNAMESRMKTEQGVEKVGDLESRYLPPDEEKQYQKMLSAISRSSVWKKANQEQKESAEEDLYNLLIENNDGKSLQEKISSGAEFGIDSADYILYRLALSMQDQPKDESGHGSYSQEEAEEAILSMAGLSGDEKEYLWQSTNKGWGQKSNPFG